jgi:hypothetical protein
MNIEIGSRVELLSDKEKVYKLAVGGSQGVVTDTKVDEGFPMVYVEWDKDHWRYEGEPDCWTFESHFKVLENGLFKALDSKEDFLKEIIERAQEREDFDDERIDRFIDRLDEAINLLAESDGFLLISAKKEVHPENPDEIMMTPYVFSGYLDQSAMVLTKRFGKEVICADGCRNGNVSKV